MTQHVRRSIAPFSSQTVWNEGLAGTGAAGDGPALTVGHDGEWMPEHLLLLAVESCFMSTLLSMTNEAGIRVVGYVSRGELRVPDDDGAPAVALSPCVVVASAEDRGRVTDVAARAARASVVLRLLGDRVTLHLDVRVLPDTSSG